MIVISKMQPIMNKDTIYLTAKAMAKSNTVTHQNRF
jgi:hypothetical protein